MIEVNIILRQWKNIVTVRYLNCHYVLHIRHTTQKLKTTETLVDE